MHITASVFINDNESGLHEDYQKWLEHQLELQRSREPEKKAAATVAANK